MESALSHAFFSGAYTSAVDGSEHATMEALHAHDRAVRESGARSGNGDGSGGRRTDRRSGGSGERGHSYGRNRNSQTVKKALVSQDQERLQTDAETADNDSGALKADGRSYHEDDIFAVASDFDTMEVKSSESNDNIGSKIDNNFSDSSRSSNIIDNRHVVVVSDSSADCSIPLPNTDTAESDPAYAYASVMPERRRVQLAQKV